MPLSDLVDIGHTKPGLPPGTLVYIGDRRSDSGKITIRNYTKNTYSQKEVKNANDCIKAIKKPGVTWINVDGLHNLKMIENIGDEFGLHSMLLEDLVNTEQRPKIDEFERYMFIVLKDLTKQRGNDQITDAQIGIVIGKKFVISFHEKKDDVFKTVVENLKNNRGRIRHMGADYLAYALIDSVIDEYFVLLEKAGEKIGKLEEELMDDVDEDTLQKIQRLKREMLFIRKSIWPMREVSIKLQRTKSELIKKGTMIYLKDLQDHVIQIIDTVETFNSMLSNMLDVHLSSISFRTNEVMKVLTIISTVFIPLTFITGLYGMNFKYMPELYHPMGYYGTLMVMAVIALTLLAYFKRKEWI